MDYKTYETKLKELIAFKSVSTDPAYKQEVGKAVIWISNIFKQAGFEVKTLKASGINPVVMSSLDISKEAKTVLVYGHYDVQPASRKDGWNTDPFSLFEKNNRLYARGIVDNKGQFLIHALTAIELAKTKKLKYNLRFLIEGNEETGNPKLSALVRKYKDKLKPDIILVSDGEISGENPVIDVSFRGGLNMKIIYKTADTPVHSGLYGGAIPNAAYELSKLIGKIYGKTNKVNIPGFYEGSGNITKEQKENNQKLFSGVKSVKDAIGVKTLQTEKGLDFLTQTGLRPTLQISGIKSGYIGEGYANIVPNTAEVRINIRTSPTQNPKYVIKSIKNFVKKQTPPYVDCDVHLSSPHSGIAFNAKSELFLDAINILTKVFKKKVYFKNVGGAIPVITDFKEIFNLDTVSIGFGNEDCNMHGVNENFRIDLIKKGLRFSNLFFKKNE